MRLTKKLVEAVAIHAYDEWRLGRAHGRDYPPMWHAATDEVRRPRLYRAAEILKPVMPKKRRAPTPKAQSPKRKQKTGGKR